jgi:hypothetical protein
VSGNVVNAENWLKNWSKRKMPKNDTAWTLTKKVLIQNILDFVKYFQGTAFLVLRLKYVWPYCPYQDKLTMYILWKIIWFYVLACLNSVKTDMIYVSIVH